MRHWFKVQTDYVIRFYRNQYVVCRSAFNTILFDGDPTLYVCCMYKICYQLIYSTHP